MTLTRSLALLAVASLAASPAMAQDTRGPGTKQLRPAA